MSNMPEVLTSHIRTNMLAFVDEYQALFPEIDKEKAVGLIKTNEHFNFLTEKWYEYLDESLDKAYSVYNDDYYFTDMWNCYKVYSRSYLRLMHKPSISNKTKSIRDYMGNVPTIVDLGCGCGLTTTALTQMYPDSKIYATNLRDTKQWQFCSQRAEQFGFELIDSVAEINTEVDFVFASEYFEHILDPISHVQDIVQRISPRFFIIANAFNTHSIGHFNTYIIKDNMHVDQTKISRMFSRMLTDLGYKKVKTSLFNGRPAFWEKVS